LVSVLVVYGRVLAITLQIQYLSARGDAMIDALRVCSRCEKVYIGHQDCPVCDYGSYNAIWAIGFFKAIIRLITGAHREA